MSYLSRTIDAELDLLLQDASAVCIDGPKGVGKTASALRHADQYWMLDDLEQKALLAADPKFLTAQPGTLLIDEWQKFPSVWDVVRRQVDAGAPPGRFLLTGSASPVSGVDTHSGAGRILSLRMRPMAWHERGVAESAVSLAQLLEGTQDTIEGRSRWSVIDYFAAITSSGFPGISTRTPRSQRAYLDAYIQRVIDRDLPDQGFEVRQPGMLRRWLAAYAAATSTTATYNTIATAVSNADGTHPARTTTLAYREHLTQLWLLDPVYGWTHSRNPLKRVQMSPKHQLADPALAARLLNVTDSKLNSPSGAHLAGPLFESLVTLTVRVAAQAAEANVGHLRTQNGDHEVDLIVEGYDGRVLGIEVKLAAHVTDADVRHLLWLREKLPHDVVDLMVVTTGEHAYRRPDGVAVVPFGLLGA